MEKYKVRKDVLAERMWQSNAEKIIGPITNITHGNDGYLVEDDETGAHWVPKSVFELNAVKAESRNDRILLWILEAEEQQRGIASYLKHEVHLQEERLIIYPILRRIKTYIKDLNKLLNYQPT